MKRLRFGSMAFVAVLAVAAGSNRAMAAETCGEFGTAVIFADSPAEAARQALQEEKLVFVLHVSGHFAESDYT